MKIRPEVTYYYRGTQDGTPLYSRKNEFPWIGRRACQQDASREGKKAVFEMNVKGHVKQS
jgi:hypothetical protein